MTPDGTPPPGGLAHGSAIVLLALASAVGCAGVLAGGQSAFDRHFETGRHEAAIDSFEADSALQRRARPLFRAGLVYADPGGSPYDPDRARQLLLRLTELHPDTEYRHQARAILSLLERVREADDRAARLRKQLKRLKAVHLGAPPDTSGGDVPRR